MRIHKTCDGVKRRDFLKVGVLGGTGLTLANYLQLVEAGDVAEQSRDVRHLRKLAWRSIAHGHV